MKCTNPRPIRTPLRDKLGQSKPLLVDCGKCPACLANKTREWTLRLNHEAQLAKTVHFITLTYDENHKPSDGVSKQDVVDFISNLRKVCGNGIRYFIGSEYGESVSGTRRPHYHGLIFNAPDDLWLTPCAGAARVEKRIGKRNALSFVNTAYNDIWRKGFVSVGSFHPRRAGYLAHYYVDKADAPDGFNPNFSLMSKRPGIGNSYALSVASKLAFGSPLLSHVGTAVKQPRYYRNIVRSLKGEEFEWSDELVDQMNSQKIEEGLAQTVEAQQLKYMNWQKHPRSL